MAADDRDSRWTPCTLEGFAAARRLDPARLRELRIRDAEDGLRLPCLDERGRPTGTMRVRRFLESSHPTTWIGAPLIYGLQTLRRAREVAELALVEGESDQLTLCEHGIPSLGVPGWSMTKLLECEHVEGIARVYLVREPDDGGTKFVAAVAERLRELGWRGKLLIVDINAAHGAKDVSELHVEDPERFTEGWRAALESAAPHADVRAAAGAAAAGFNGEPQPLSSLALRAPSLPEELLPAALRPWIVDVSERMRVPLEMIAVPAMVACAALVGRRLTIRPKRRDDFTVVPNLWGALVCRSGYLKSPALAEAMRPLRRIEAEKRDDYARELASHQASHRVVELGIAALEQQIKKGKAQGVATKLLEQRVRKAQHEVADAHLVAALAEKRQALEAARIPAEPRISTSDATVEKLGYYSAFSSLSIPTTSQNGATSMSGPTPRRRTSLTRRSRILPRSTRPGSQPRSTSMARSRSSGSTGPPRWCSMPGATSLRSGCGRQSSPRIRRSSRTSPSTLARAARANRRGTPTLPSGALCDRARADHARTRARSTVALFDANAADFSP